MDLHVHLVGSASPDTIRTLRRRHADRDVCTDPPVTLGDSPLFTDFRHFVEVYTAVSRLVTNGSDITELVFGLAADLAASNVRYAEVTVTPMAHLAAGIDAEELVEALAIGRRRAAEEHSVELSWVFDISGDLGPLSGLDTARWVLTHQPDGTIGFGLGGPEIGVARGQFREAFGLARAAGLHSVPHAGETTGPEEVWVALRALGAERIGHGIRSVHDQRLLSHLAEHGISLEVCLTSNLCTRAVADLAAHPLPDLLASGVPVSLGTDDPGMFRTNLNREYLICHEVFGASPGELTDIAKAGVRAAFCSAESRRALLDGIDVAARRAVTTGW
ncbi:MAG TPA: adenosine deaminase [Pseudonocardiaceae bacterium]|nr:adenosine deaminase [Pseudonocardiaceae bacterium]